MSLIAMCSFSTKENGKFEYLKQTLEMLLSTVDFDKHRLFIIDNNSYPVCVEYLKQMSDLYGFTVIFNDTNLGTAGGINLAIRERLNEEFVIKCDDDWTTEHIDWVDEMERVMSGHPEIGILGLKRDDVYGELVEDGELLWNNDIMGTCTMYNPEMLDKCGYLYQPSPIYGFDDVDISVRSTCAGFKNSFMKNIRIVNLDKGGTEFTEWKKREAGLFIQEASINFDMYRSGKLPYYWDGGFNS